MLTLSNLAKSYAGRTLFRDASLQVNRGERIGLVGPNGAGKSTLFSIILKENSPDEGQVILERGASLGFLPQESAPVGDESVLSLATSHETDEYAALSLQPKAKHFQVFSSLEIVHHGYCPRTRGDPEYSRLAMLLSIPLRHVPCGTPRGTSCFTPKK